VQQQQQAPAEAAKQPAQQQQQPQQRVAMPSLAPQQQQQQQQQEQLLVLPRPVQWYEQQSSYSWKVLGLVLVLLATMVLLNTLLLTLPIGLGRALFTALRLPCKNDLFTGIVGLVVLSGAYTLAAAVASSASLMNLRAFAAAAWRWGLLMGQCGVLVVLWLGVVATMLGMLCELVLLPLRLPPNQTALIYLYQVRGAAVWWVGVWNLACCAGLLLQVVDALLLALPPKKFVHHGASGLCRIPAANWGRTIVSASTEQPTPAAFLCSPCAYVCVAACCVAACLYLCVCRTGPWVSWHW
jgi:hypothetical protein